MSFMMIFFIALFGAKMTRADWREPTAPPPTKNIYPPLTVSGEPQAKAGKLKLDPNFNPDNLTTLLTYPLEVVGTGKVIKGAADNLRVADTLFVSADEDKVDIASKPTNNSAKLTVYGGKVQIGTELNPVSGQALWGESASGHGILGTTLASSSSQVYAGVRGENNNARGYGVWGLSSSSGANARSGVYGQTKGGAGIYGVTNSYLYAAVYGENTAAINMGWAGYFDGNLGAGSDVVSSRFLPTNLRRSLIPFTSGQAVSNYSFGQWSSTWPDNGVLAFDGTYVWLATNRDDSVTHNNLFKLRASDGQLIKSYQIGDNLWAITFDGRYLWLLDQDGDLRRFDPVNETAAPLVISGASLELDSDDTTPYLAVSHQSGHTYIWLVDRGDDRVIKVNSFLANIDSAYSLDALVDSAVYDPMGITYDGKYIWVAARGDGGYLIRLWAENPSNPTDPADRPLRFDTTTDQLACPPYNVVADGLHVWCLPDQGSDTELVRVWAANPNDPRHPAKDFGAFSSVQLKDGTTDGTYLWVVSLQDRRLYRFLLADPGQYTYFTVSFEEPKEILFDGTYLWIPETSGTAAPTLHKYFSGNGLGHTDLTTVVNLDSSPAQNGNFNIFGTAEVGGTLSVGGDLVAKNNTWDPAGDDVAVPVFGGLASCAVNGHFIKGITIGADHKISAIVCRGL